MSLVNCVFYISLFLLVLYNVEIFYHSPFLLHLYNFMVNIYDILSSKGERGRRGNWSKGSWHGEYNTALCLPVCHHCTFSGSYLPSYRRPRPSLSADPVQSTDDKYCIVSNTPHRETPSHSTTHLSVTHSEGLSDVLAYSLASCSTTPG